MRAIFAQFVSLILIWALAGSGFSQTASVSERKVDPEISPDRIIPSPSDVLALRIEQGFIAGRVKKIGPGKQSIEVETRSGNTRSYPIDLGVRFERLQKILKDLKKGDTVRLELAMRGGTEVVTDIEKIG